ncbi:MAG: DNA repair protein RecO [Desulfotomaculaceae bacterium]|nr:DNA repair protein RecO [Desulfotomaculaceae bacterium]
MKLYKADAVVLRARDCGSGNKLLILYSREYGKIKVMAHGVSKPTSRKRGAVQPFTLTRFLIYRGRELDSVSQCEGVEMFSFLKGNLEMIGYASYLAELVDALTPEREPNANLFTLFLETLRLMAAGDIELLVRAFEIKAVGLIGYRPVLESCAQCLKPFSTEVFFSPCTGGVVCSACGPNVPDAAPCSRGVVETLKVLLSWPPARLPQIKVERRARNRIKYLLHEYLKYHLEQDFKSAAFLNKYITPPGL